MSIRIQEYRPSQELRPYVHRFWTGQFRPSNADGIAQRVVPHGFVDVIFHLSDRHCNLPGAEGWRPSPDYMLIGLQSSTYEVRFTADVRVFAVRFKPAGFYTLFGVPFGETAGAYEDLEAVLGSRISRLAAQLRDAASHEERIGTAERFLRRAVGRREMTYLNHAAELIRKSGGTLRIDELASNLSISGRQLERAFRKKLGLSPKQYLRIARINRVQGLLEDGEYRSLADVAYRAGYADQSHFNREFKEFVGAQPTRFLAEREAFVVRTGESLLPPGE